MSVLNPYDPLAALRATNPYVPTPQQPTLQPLQPQEENSLLGQIAGKALGGVGYVGSVLEKTFGGRAIRGLLGGKPRELLSVLPGSDTLGLTDEADRVSGKELLGMQHDDSWGATLAGLGTELALDPGMYLSFGAGAIGKAGGIAKALGKLPGSASGRVSGTLAQILQAEPALQGAAETAAGGAQHLGPLLHEPLGGLVGLGLPLSKPSALLGTGQAGADFLAGAGKLATGADAALRALPGIGGLYGQGADLVGKGLDVAGRYGKALFSPEVMGATSHLGQEAASEAHAGIRPLVAEHLQKAARYGEDLRQAGVDPTGEVLRGVIEGTYQGPVHPAIAQAATAIRGDLDATLSRLQGLGVDIGQLADQGVNYLPRYQSPLSKPTAGYGAPRQPLLAVDPRVSSREDILKGFTEGSTGINRMILDPEVYEQGGRALTPLESAAVIRGKYLNPTLPKEAAIPQSARLAEWVRSLDPQYRASIGTANPLNFFGNHPLADYADYYQRIGRLHGAADATQNLLARTAELASPAQQLPAGARSLVHALEDLRLTGPGGQSTLLDRLNAARAGQVPLTPGELANFYVPQNTLDEASRYLRGFQSPEAVNAVLGGFDKLTTLTKAWQTAPWPAFHVRNLLSGMWQNWIKGGSVALGEVPNAYKLLKGEVIPGASKIGDFAARGLDDAAATRELAQEMYAWGVGGHMPHLSREVAGPLGTPVNLGPDLEGFLARIPGYQPKSVGGALEQSIPRSLEQANPLNVAGVGSTQDLTAPVAGGRQLGDVVEGVNRGSLYMSLRKQGYTPEAAAKEVLAAHFDYTRGAKTDLEAKVLSRLVPFYSYSRQNIPHQLEQLAQHPGGAAGALARVADDLRQQSGFLPDYLGSGLAVPLGAEEGGTQRYLTRLDTPVEQAFEMLHGGPRGAQNSLMAALSQLNPLVKGPLEYATGKQFFTGRDLGDLYSMSGSATLDQLLANSPASRLATTARTLADERKWESPGAALAIPLNLGTGAKVSDVDLARQRTIAEREYLTEMLRGQPEVGSFSTVYPKVPLDQLSPEQLLLLRLNKTVEQKAQQAAKQQKIRIQ